MGERKYGLNIEYRITCEKKDPRNICSDAGRTKGFFWQYAKSIALQEEFEALGITDTMPLEEIQERLERVSLPENCEAIRAELTIYLPGSTGCNGTYRRNVTFEYFKDFTEKLGELVPAHPVKVKESAAV